MMDVAYSDSITNTIKGYRETLYCTDEFKNKFSENLKTTINATDISYVPNQFGGWDINATMGDIQLSNDTSYDYTKSISEALENTIREIDKTKTPVVLAANLINVTATGNNTITVNI